MAAPNLAGAPQQPVILRHIEPGITLFTASELHVVSSTRPQTKAASGALASLWERSLPSILLCWCSNLPAG